MCIRDRPLARQHRSDDNLIEAWDLIIGGVERGTGFSELIDPVIQRERLVAQSVKAAAGDLEAMQLDEDFLAALELGAPPMGGMGLGLDRLMTVSYTHLDVYKRQEPVLWRRNRDMALTVRADVLDGVQGPAATSRIWPTLQSIVASLPPGYRIEIGGAAEETKKSDTALFAVFPLMFVVMLFFLMLQLQSFSRMGMVFLTAPLALIGVVPALLIFNAPFGFVALLGVIALSGMIMRNAVILVDQIDTDIAAGAPAITAVVEATVRRSRPVVLTGAAAVLAMVPVSYTHLRRRRGWRRVRGPAPQPIRARWC